MIIGIISDSHGNARRLRTAVDFMARRGAKAIVHCGDLGSVECVRVLASSGLPCFMVAGNMDRRVEELADAAEEGGVNFGCEVITVPLGDGRDLAATHGDDQNVLQELIREQKYPYICHGHTHLWRDEKIGQVRIINPGALHRTAVHTAAILDTGQNHIEQVVFS